MKSLKYYIVLLAMFFCGANLVYANIEITEIMYAPESGSGHEWVEILNTGSDSINLDKHRFFHGFFHGETISRPITLKVGDTTILESGEYAIIAKRLDDYSWLDTSVTIFSSSVLSLPDTGENTYIAVSDSNKNILDSVTYDTSLGGSKTSKSSLSKIDNTWDSGIPTPGSDNQKMEDLGIEEDTDGGNSSSTVNYNKDTPTSSSNVVPIILKVTTKIISSKTVLAGVPFSVSSLTTTNRGETYKVGNYLWNFGDGRINKTRESGPFEYTYEYPGEYIVTLSYFDSFLDDENTAVGKMIIKVVPSEIYISSVGDTSDPFIEIENKSNYEILLSDWIVTGGNHFFIIPVGTTILPGKKIKFSSKITGFIAEDLNFVNIANKNKEVMATYPVVTKRIFKKITSNLSSNNLTTDEIKKSENVLIKDSEIINLNDLGASAEKNGVNMPIDIYPILGLSGIIGIGIISFLLIKKNKDKENTDGVIRAKDMTIVE